MEIDGAALEAVRVVAQGHAYDAGRPEEVRREWAALSLLANRRMGDAGSAGRAAHQEFMLRMWVIDTFGPHPDWSPHTLATDTLGALPLPPSEARALARDWRDLPVDRIRELRRHKNLTAHLERLIGHLEAGPTRDRLLRWIEVRRQLP
ncbi:hypothetical protein H4N64_22520 [Streptomyces sp. PSKA01]|uniref:Uncharacterized protein n=2 Tax=Streptomyces cupreus TaxID=2759956 RepID=A0A7X1J629_9ACTN|nr:hypothetical protein [Streptomyces cupreus]